MPRRGGIPHFAIVTVVALASVLVGTPASAAPPPGVSMDGTGPPPPGVGLLSTAALAQQNCAESGQTWSTYEGGGPWCVNPFPAGKKNGGATAPGVTATDVKVIAYVPNDQMLAASTSPKPMDQATKAQTTPARAFEDIEKAYAYAAEHNGTYQLWGRKPTIELFTATGADEAAQRADAVAVIAKKPFMVVDATSTTTGAPVFSSLVADKKIVVASASTDAKAGTGQAPYRWNTTNDPSSTPVVTAAFIGKSLNGKKARWAGDELSGKTRTFGAVYPTTGVDFAEFERLLTQNGGKLTEKFSYDPANAQGGAVDFATFVTRLKSSGVTSVILFTPRDVVKTLMDLATSQSYFPEWIYTGVNFHEYMNIARQNDPQQMAHAFGLGQIGPYLTNDPRITLAQWYWGTTQGATWPGALGPLEFVYNAMHYAGPDLTAKNVQKGLFAAPAQKIPRIPAIGNWGYGKTVGTPYNAVGANGSDRAVMWWDPDTEGQALATPVGKGVWEFLNNGENVSYKEFTKKEPKLFDKSASVIERNALDYYPGGVAPTPIPCPQCPANGGTPS